MGVIPFGAHVERRLFRCRYATDRLVVIILALKRQAKFECRSATNLLFMNRTHGRNLRS